MKKIFSVILAFTICLSGINAFAATPYEVTTTEDYKLGLLSTLGILDENNLPSTARPLTRGEFAVYAVRLLGGMTADTGISFWDVPQNSECAAAVATLAGMDAIHGYADGSFNPTGAIDAYAAVKILNCMLGYNEYAVVSGGWSQGHIETARRNGLIENSTVLPSGSLPNELLIELLYRALNVKPMKITGTADDRSIQLNNYSSKTFLEQYFDMFVDEGIISATNNSTLKSNASTVYNAIKINGNTYKCDDRFDKYLGQNVMLFYKSTNEADPEAIYVCPTDDNRSATIEPEDIESFVAGTLSYTLDGRQKSETFSSDVCVLYNGKAIDFTTDYNASLFDITDGSVTLLSNDGDDKADVIFVKSYETMVVKNVNLEKETIYDKYTSTKTLDLSDSSLNVSIKDVSGNKLAIEDLKSWDVLSVAKSKDEQNIEIIVSYKTAEGVVGSYQTDDKYGKITVAGNMFEILNREFVDKVGIKLGGEYVFYINASGYVVAVENTGENKYNFGLAYGAYNELEAASEVVLRFVDETGALAKYPIAEKVKIDGKSDLTTAQKLAVFAPTGTKYCKIPIRYKLNQNGELIEIDTPVYDSSRESEETIQTRYNGELTYKNNGTFYGKFAVDASTFIAAIPAVGTGETDYNPSDVKVIYSSALKNDSDYDVKAYTIDNDSRVLDMIILDNGSYSQGIQGSSAFCVVSKIFTGVDENNEEATGITYYTNNAEASKYVIQEKTDVAKALKPGDIIQTSIDIDGKIEDIRVLYQYEEKTLGSAVLPANNYYNKDPRLVFARIYEISDPWITVVISDDVNDAFKSDGSENDDMLEVHKITSAYAYSVNDRGKIEMKKITAKDMIDYKSGGDDAARILFKTTYGRFDTAIVINY